MSNEDKTLARLINEYASYAIAYWLRKDKGFLESLELTHAKIKEFISGGESGRS